MTIRLPDEQHERLKTLAIQLEEFATRALTEFDVEARFRVRAARGDLDRSLALLDKVDVAALDQRERR